jgi:hypothetical protein
MESGSTSLPFLASRRRRLLQVVGPEPLVAALALGERVGEGTDVTRGDPDLARQDDRGVEADDVLAGVDHRTPPLALDVLLELDTERPVVPRRARAAVDLPAREDEPRRLQRETTVSTTEVAWPRLSMPERMMRVAVVVMMAAIAITQAVPRG